MNRIISLSCVGSPCIFGCISSVPNGPLCGCPNGYRTIGQGHCLATINQNATIGSSQQQQQLEPYRPHDKYISTEGCFSCRTNNGRNRRSLRVVNGKKLYGPPVKLTQAIDQWNVTGGQNSWSNLEDLTNSLPPKWLARLEDKNLTHGGSNAWFNKAGRKSRRIRKTKRHFNNDEQLNLKVTLPQTKHRMRIIKLQPAVKSNFDYRIINGNDQKQFEMVKKHGVWALHFRKRLKHPGDFRLEIDGHPTEKLENDTWEKPLTLRVHINAT